MKKKTEGLGYGVHRMKFWKVKRSSINIKYSYGERKTSEGEKMRRSTGGRMLRGASKRTRFEDSYDA